MRDPASGRFRIAFRVFCAAGFERGRPRLWRVEAFPDASQANWEAFLRALEGAPPRVVCDNHYGLNGAVRAAFPEAELYLCEWHLRHVLERLMAKIRQSDEHRAAIDALLPRVEAAFTGPSFWKPFVRDAQAADIPRLSSWLEGAGRVLEDPVLSVVGFDNVHISAMARISLTTVAQPLDVLARLAVERALGRLNRSVTGPPEHTTVEPCLKLRGSTGPA